MADEIVAPAEGAPEQPAAEQPTGDKTPKAPEAEGTPTNEGAEPKVEEGAQAKADEAAAPVIEVKLPEGVEPDPALMDALRAAAKDGASAQALADAYVAAQAASEAKAKESWTATQQQWADQLKADPDVGGARYDASVIAADKAITRYADADLRQLLEQTGLRNHPQMFRFMVRVGQSLSEDRSIGTGGTQKMPRTMSDVLRTDYPTMFKDKE